MRSFSFLWLLIGFLFNGSLHAALSLRDCQNLALANSEKMTIADLQALIEQDRLSETRSLIRPRLNAEANYIWSGEPKHFHKTKGIKTARISLTVPLFDLSSCNLIQAQKKLYHSSLFSADNIEQDLLYAVHTAYFHLLAAQKLEEIIQHSISSIDEQLRITADFHQQGLLHRNDVLQVEVQLAQLKQDAIEARHQTLLAQASLNRLIGWELNCPIEIEDVAESNMGIDNLEEMIALAKAKHPALLALQAQMAAIRYQYKAEQAQFYPSVYAFTNYSSTGEYALPYRHGIDAGIGVQLSLYEGGSTLAKLRRIKKEQCELDYQYRAIEKDIELSLRTAYLTIQSALCKIPVALKSISFAEENLVLTKDLFEEGLVTASDVMSDEAGVVTALVNYYQALYTYYQAKTDLIYSAGLMNREECPYHDYECTAPVAD
ncbi:TolC family protein [Candidatus Protochlamydia phocaeensis]|uniref:TolC family protein n=1 Tax=Candidatus Protochlamydia phocaeensis TaxID=1414722 RepID=UPI0008380ED3|nr:TolC family protein [Candidatus Protochlamydia phocaeensis]